MYLLAMIHCDVKFITFFLTVLCVKKLHILKSSLCVPTLLYCAICK
jgi:hypothetical protein